MQGSLLHSIDCAVGFLVGVSRGDHGDIRSRGEGTYDALVSDSITSPDIYAPTGLTYDDVLLLPRLTDVVPSEVDSAAGLGD